MGGASGDEASRLRVPLDWVVPDLAGLVPPGGRVETSSDTESRVYYDTATDDLADAGVELSRVPDTSAAPWRVQIDGDGVSVPAAGRGVPAAVRDQLLGVRAGAALRIVRRVETERSVHTVRDAAGAEVGEIADVRDHVATTGAAATVAQRRHVEIAGWDGPYLSAAAKQLRKSGALEVSVSAAPAPKTLGAALQQYIAQCRRDLLRHDLQLRRGDSPIHAMRVALRRLRSALRIIDVTEASPRAAFDADLSWLAGLLGEVRDRQVLRRHLRLDPNEADTAVVSAVALIESVLDTEEAVARAELADAMSGRRYMALLRTLREWSSDAPMTAAAAKPATRLTRYVDRAVSRMDRRLAAAGRSGDVDADLHRARKAAKRARYAANLAVPVLGKPARKNAKAAKQIQSELGDHQDAVVAAQFLRRLAGDAQGEAAFACGVLWVREQGRIERLRRSAGY